MINFSINSTEVKLIESASETDDTKVGILNSTINYLSETLEGLKNGFINLFDFSKDSNENEITRIFNEEAETYKAELNRDNKLEEIRSNYKLPVGMDFLNDSSLEFLKILEKDVSLTRGTIQTVVKKVQFFCTEPVEYFKTPFQNLIPLIEDFEKKQKNISSEIESIKTDPSSIENSLEAISTSIKSLNEKFEFFKTNIIEWKKQKSINSDIDKLKVIALKNLIRDMIIDINSNKIELNNLQIPYLINKIKHQKANEKFKASKEKILNMKLNAAAKKALNHR